MHYLPNCRPIWGAEFDARDIGLEYFEMTFTVFMGTTSKIWFSTLNHPNKFAFQNRFKTFFQRHSDLLAIPPTSYQPGPKCQIQPLPGHSCWALVGKRRKHPRKTFTVFFSFFFFYRCHAIPCHPLPSLAIACHLSRLSHTKVYIYLMWLMCTICI